MYKNCRNLGTRDGSAGPRNPYRTQKAKGEAQKLCNKPIKYKESVPSTKINRAGHSKTTKKEMFKKKRNGE